MTRVNIVRPGSHIPDTVGGVPKNDPLTAALRKQKKQHEWPQGEHRRMYIGKEFSEKFLVVPYAPREVSTTGLADPWEEISRDARTPLLLRNGRSLPRHSFALFLGSYDWNEPVVDQLNYLIGLAQSKQRVRISFSSWETGTYRITRLDVQSTTRHELTQEITRATVDIELIRDQDPAKNTGPVNGGVQNNGESYSDPRPRRQYRVQKGDTLIKIAIKVYKDQRMWRKIAKENDIRHPKKALTVGRMIWLP